MADLTDAIKSLLAQGIKVSADDSSIHAKKYVVKLPNGNEYEFFEADLGKLQASGNLSPAGIEAAFLKNHIPNSIPRS
jgi:regulatory protein YycI of two-component signal transduction system YycFG